MKINTRKFGEIDIAENKILTMPDGLPGFPGFDRFVLLEDPNSVPFCWFQSVETPNLALVVMNPFVFKPDYSIDLNQLVLSKGWGNVKMEDLLVYVVITISGSGPGKSITANLMGPLVINLEKKEVVQMVIPDAGYSHQFNVLESLPEDRTG